jgi:hypothetical protein
VAAEEFFSAAPPLASEPAWRRVSVQASVQALALAWPAAESRVLAAVWAQARLGARQADVLERVPAWRPVPVWALVAPGGLLAVQPVPRDELPGVPQVWPVPARVWPLAQVSARELAQDGRPVALVARPASPQDEPLVLPGEPQASRRAPVPRAVQRAPWQ